MIDTRTDLPLYNTPFLDSGGNITEVWWRFFYTILTRTGGTEGSSLDEIIAQIELLLKMSDSERASRLSSVARTDSRPDGIAPSPVALSVKRAMSSAPAPVINHGQHGDGGLHDESSPYSAGFIGQTDTWHLRAAYDVGGIKVSAHRGFMTQAPQNTALAYSTALRSGADALECDVSVSADGVYYVFHDTTVDTLTDGTGTFTELSSAYIDSLELDFGVGTRFSPIRISRFDQFLEIANAAGKYIYPEFKRFRSAADLPGMIDMIVQYKMDRLCCVSSFSMNIIRQARAYNANIDLGFLGLSTDEAEVRGNIDEVAALGRGILIWDADATLAIPGAVAYAFSQGVDWAVYTPSQSKDIPALRQLGIRRIVSNTTLGAPR